MKTLIIDKSKWYRGNGTFGSKLLRENDRKMCCLGFYCLNEGFKESEIKEIEYPSLLRNEKTNVFSQHKEEFYGKLLHDNETYIKIDYNDPFYIKPKLQSVIASINDCKGIDDETRIELLRPLFREYLDMELEFVEGNE